MQPSFFCHFSSVQNPFKHLIDFEEVGFRIFLEGDIEVLVKAPMKISVTVGTVQYAPLKFSSEAVPNEVNMVKLQSVITSANIAKRIPCH